MAIEYIDIIVNDFKIPFLTAGPALLIGIILVFGICWIYRKHNKVMMAPVQVALFIAYCIIIFQTAFFSREPGSRDSISLILFETWGNNFQSHMFFIENIIMFIPFGVLVPMLINRCRNAFTCLIAGFLASCFLESAQLITQRGYFQLDDILTNSLGTIVGWLMWNHFIRKNTKHKENE